MAAVKASTYHDPHKPPTLKPQEPHSAFHPPNTNPSPAHLRACGFFPDVSALACLSEERMNGCGALAGTIRVSHSEFLNLGLICYSVLPLLRKGTEPPLTSDPGSLLLPLPPFIAKASSIRSFVYPLLSSPLRHLARLGDSLFRCCLQSDWMDPGLRTRNLPHHFYLSTSQTSQRQGELYRA
jgi:hypothetical protein